MNCNECQQRLQQGTSPDAATSQHLQHCAACRTAAGDRQLQQKLNALSAAVPPPDAGFSRRVTEGALAYRRDTRPAAKPVWQGGAIAAGFVLAVMLMFGLNGLPQPTADGHLTASVSQQDIRYVSVLLSTPDDVAEATITLRPDSLISVKGFPEQQTVAWTTRLQAGDNRLTLPIEFSRAESGSLTIELEYQGVRKELKLHLEPPEPASGKPQAI